MRDNFGLQEVGALFDNVVDRNRGGYSFDVKVFFLYVIRSLGFGPGPLGVECAGRRVKRNVRLCRRRVPNLRLWCAQLLHAGRVPMYAPGGGKASSFSASRPRVGNVVAN